MSKILTTASVLDQNVFNQKAFGSRMLVGKKHDLRRV